MYRLSPGRELERVLLEAGYSRGMTATAARDLEKLAEKLEAIAEWLSEAEFHEQDRVVAGHYAMVIKRLMNLALDLRVMAAQ